MPAPAAAETWRLVTVSARSAARQMALDQALAESVWAGISPPTLRLYRWPVPGLTVGRHQLPDPRAGIFPDGLPDAPSGPLSGPPPGPLPCPAVRRATGGQAVFHEQEVTFALMTPRHHPLLARGVRAAYLTVAAACAEALVTLGLPLGPEAERDAAPDRAPENAPESAPESAPEAAPESVPAPTRGGPRRGFACFAHPTREETALDGCKLIAIAQRRWPQGLLTQGCLPLTGPVRLPGAEFSGAAGLARFLPGVTWTMAATALAEALGRHLGAVWEPSLPSAGERRRSFRLARGPYRPLAVEGESRLREGHPTEHHGGDGTGFGPKNPLKKPADRPKSGHEAHATG